MSDPERFRDSTQIVVPCRSIDGIRGDLQEDFSVTIIETDGQCRIIGSPAVIKDVSKRLARHGVTFA